MRAFILIISMAVVFFTACDNRIDYWADVDYFDSFQLLKSAGDTLNQISGGYTDSVKLNKQSQYSYQIINSKDCNLVFDYNKSKCNLELNTEKQIFQLTAKEIGEVNIYMTITDPFGRDLFKSFKVQCINNLPPIAMANISQIGILSPYEIEIDASLSYDADKALGGEIVEYEYEIVGYGSDNIPYNKYKRILSKPGSYTIKLRVKDNDNTWSTIKTYNFELK